MSITPNVRRAVRAIVLDEDDRILLCRFIPPHPAVPPEATGVWAAPGGGTAATTARVSSKRDKLKREAELEAIRKKLNPFGGPGATASEKAK